MPMNLTKQELAALRAKSPPDSLLADLWKDDPAPTKDDTQRIVPPPLQAPAPLLQRVGANQPTTTTYALLRAFSAASAALYERPDIRRVTGGYAIRVGASLAIGVTITEPNTTIVSYNARTKAGAWFVLEAQRMTKLAPRELLALASGKELA